MNGNGERLIAEGYLTDGPTWSPNGRTFAFFKTLKNTNNEFETKLFTIDITGNLEKELKHLIKLLIQIGDHQLSINFFNILCRI